MPVDKNDVGVGWTVQTKGNLPEVDSVPGQVFHVSQLPDPERQAVELGANYPDLYANVGGILPVYESRDEAEAQPGGPEPGELDKAELYRKPVEAARASGADGNDPEGVGNDYSVQVPSKNAESAEDKKAQPSNSSTRQSAKADDKS